MGKNAVPKKRPNSTPQQPIASLFTPTGLRKEAGAGGLSPEKMASPRAGSSPTRSEPLSRQDLKEELS